MTATPLQNLMTMPEYRAQRAHVFRSDESLRWAVRQHGDELISRGALVLIGRQKMVEPERFDSVMMDIGGRLASMRRGGRRGSFTTKA